MSNQIHPAESGKINVAPNVLASKAVEVSQGRVYILHDAVQSVLRAVPAPADTMPLSPKEQIVQPIVNEKFEQMVSAMQIDEPQVPATDPNTFISLTGNEHPNQEAIDEALRNALAAHDDNSVQDLRV